MIRLTSNRGIPVYGTKTFLLDSTSEIASLPTRRIAPGSMAFVSQDSSQYILNTAYKWVKVQSSGSGDIIYEGGDITGDGSNDTESDGYREIIYEGGEI